jgi:pyruvyltransferase
MKLFYFIFLCIKTPFNFFRRNRIILNKGKYKSRKNRVNLHWWRVKSGKENLGDYLSSVVCEYAASLRGKSFDDSVRSTKHLYAVGSIITAGFQNAAIWGSGLITEPVSVKEKLILSKVLRTLDIRAVRGPKTREYLIKAGHNCPEKYGDPAILLPLIYTPKKLSRKKKYAVVLHHETKLFHEENINIETTDYKAFSDELCNSEKVISSSLHGIILAEAYGIPAVLLNDTPAKKSMFKFDDYYFSTKRFEYPVAESIEEALKTKPPPLPANLEEMQKDLLELFPYDLWDE